MLGLSLRSSSTPFWSIVIRAGSLACRLALTIYLASFAGMQAVAMYGLLMSAVAGTNALSGLGLAATVNRQLVGMPSVQAVLLLRDRLIVRLAVCFILALMYFLVDGATDLPTFQFPVIGFAVVVGEALVDDMQKGFVIRQRGLASNLFHFIRSGSWVLPVIILGIFFEDFRNLQAVLSAWLASLAISAIIALAIAIRVAKFRLFERPDLRFLLQMALTSGPLYLGHVAGVAAIFIDRVIVAALLGLDDAGVFIFLWSLANAISSLVQAGHTHLAFPRLVSAWRGGGRYAWKRETYEVLRNVVFTASILAVAMIVLLHAALPALGAPIAYPPLSLTIMMSVAVIMKLLADVLHEAIYSAGRDTMWIGINVALLAWTTPMFAACIHLFGLEGAGIASLSSAFTLFALRFAVFSTGKLQLPERNCGQ